ncbi:MAG: CHAT domain-containing tetratricopeptide repeat protein [Bacteroidota bacterium]
MFQRILATVFFLTLCKSYFAQVDTTEAHVAWKKAVEFDSDSRFDSANHYYKLAFDQFKLAASKSSAPTYNHRMLELSGDYANSLAEGGKYEPALELVDSVENYPFVRLDDSPLQKARLLLLRGYVYFRTGDFERSKELSNTAIDMFEQHNLPKDHHLGQAWKQQGLAGFEEGDYEYALSSYQRALDIFRKAPDAEEMVGITLGEIGLVYRRKSNFSQALSYYNQALDMLRKQKGDKHPNVGVTLVNMATVSRNMGDFQQALLYADEGLSIFREALGNSHPFVGQTLMNIGIMHKNVAAYDKSLKTLEEARSILVNRFGEEHYYAAVSHQNIGLIYEAKRDYQTALDHYLLSVRTLEAFFQKPNINTAECYQYIGHIFHKMEDSAQSFAFFKKGADMLLETVGEHHDQLSELYMQWGESYEHFGYPTQALEKYQDAIMANSPGFTPDSPDEVPSKDAPYLNPWFMVNVMRGKARVLQQFTPAQTQLAHQHLQRAISDLERIRYSLKTEGAQLRLQAQNQAVFREAIALAYQLHLQFPDQKEYLETAFLTAEKARAAMLLAGIQETKARKFAGIPDHLLDNEQEIKSDLAYYQKKLLAATLAEKQDSLEVARLKGQVFRLTQRADSLVELFEQQYPDYHELKYRPPTTDFSKVVAWAKSQQQALIEFFVGKEDVYVFLFHPEGEQLLKLSQTESLEEDIVSLINLLNGKKEYQQQQFVALSAKLGKTLLPEVPGNIKGITLVPDGLLGYLPFELLSPAFLEGKILLDEYPVHYAYSASLLLERPQEKSSGASKLFAGFAPAYDMGNWLADAQRGSPEGWNQKLQALPPLAFNQPEVSGIQALLGGESYVGNSATEAAFKEQAGNFRILHLAMHALVDDAYPLYSGLVFSQQATDSMDDGMLHAYELYNLPLNADLVVLSACNTGVGKLARGEGILSMARAFRYAGCPSIVTSLWQVDDRATQEIMTSFYELLNEGQTRAEALRNAKLAYRKAHPEVSPATWAALVLQGPDDEMSLRDGFPVWVWGLIALVAIVLLIGRFRKRHV